MTPEPCPSPCKDVIEAAGRIDAHDRELSALAGWVQRIDGQRETLSTETARGFAEIRAQVRMAAFFGSIVGGGIVTFAVGLFLNLATRR